MTDTKPSDGIAPPATIAKDAPTQSPSGKLPWHRVRPRTVLFATLFGLVIFCFSTKPLWQLFWYWPVYSFGNFRSVRDDQGHQIEGWRWIEGASIRIYVPPSVRPDQSAVVLAGAEAMVRDAGLNLAVTLHPMPDAVLEAYRASLAPARGAEGAGNRIHFERLASRLITWRANNPHATIMLVNEPIAECDWAQGMASFSHGLALLRTVHLSHHLAKHETGHLIGYMMHDNFPIYVLGYRDEGLPWQRNSLMLLLSTGEELSPRARDALRYFWRGVEKRTGRKYLRER